MLVCYYLKYLIICSVDFSFLKCIIFLKCFGCISLKVLCFTGACKMLWRSRTFRWSSMVMQLMSPRGSWVSSSVLPLSCYRCLKIIKVSVWVETMSIIKLLIWFFSRGCYEAYHWRALGSPGLRYMDPRFVFFVV